MANIKNSLRMIITAIIAVTSLCCNTGTAATSTKEAKIHAIETKKDFTNAQKKSIENIIHRYLLQHPEILLEASIKLREHQSQQENQQVLKSIRAVKTALFLDPKSPIAGNPEGTQLLVEFFDYQCPHCKTMLDPMKNLLAKNKNLKVIFKDWPIFGGASETAARAAIAANQQKKYLALHDALLKADNPLTEEKIMQLATSVGCDIPQLKKDMASETTDKIIKSNFKVAEKLNLQGTPAFVLGNSNNNDYTFIPGQTTEKNLQHLLNQLNK